MAELSDLDLDQLAARYHLLEQRQAFVKDQFAAVKAEILHRLATQKSVVTASGLRITAVRGVSKTVNKDRLKEILTPLDLWKLVVVWTESFSEPALENLINQGQLKEEDIVAALDVKPKAAYPRITQPKGKQK